MDNNISRLLIIVICLSAFGAISKWVESDAKTTSKQLKRQEEAIKIAERQSDSLVDHVYGKRLADSLRNLQRSER